MLLLPSSLRPTAPTHLCPCLHWKKKAEEQRRPCFEAMSTLRALSLDNFRWQENGSSTSKKYSPILVDLKCSPMFVYVRVSAWPSTFGKPSLLFFSVCGDGAAFSSRMLSFFFFQMIDDLLWRLPNILQLDFPIRNINNTSNI